MASFSNDLAGWNDTIVALATPQGVGALGIIRLCGNQALAIADKLMPGKKLAEKPSHTLHLGWIIFNDKRLDEAVAGLFISPKSFTGEDVVEFTCHGSPYVLKEVIDAAIANGARLAKPGEFTQRAFLNGKLDLAQAEAVADVIASESSAAHQAALHHLRGGFSHVLSQLREELIRFSALIELELDFATEDVEFADRRELSNIVSNAIQVTADLVNSFSLGNAIKQGVQVAIIGKPNAGKSTLLNTLLRENRAIVSEIAGTTRDTIEEVLNIDGILFRLIDTAGIRESTDVIESIGVARSMEKMRQADITVYMYDAATESHHDLHEAYHLLQAEAKQFIIVANKSDLRSSDAKIQTNDLFYETLSISAKQGTHIDILKQQLVDKVLQGKQVAEQTIITNARHYGALLELQKGLHDINNAIMDGVPGDLMAIDIRRCLQYLGEITGIITNEDQLDYIFSKFCIGK